MSAHGARHGEMHGRHAAPRQRNGPFARLGRILPTWQEILLWGQTRRYRIIDAVSLWWSWHARSAVVTVLLSAVVGAGLVLGLDLPRRG